MEVKQIKEIIEKGETEEVEFKESFHSSQDIAKILCAFANTNGGVLLLGISSKKQVAKNVLGVELKENDPVLDSIIRMNDTSKEQEYLREIGLERGYQKTKDDLTRAMMSTFGSGVVQSTAYVEGR